MKILVVSDNELRELWDFWDSAGSKRLEGVDLILSAGDLKPAYLEFLVTMTGVPLLYVRGNHDGIYDERPPEGCIDIDGKVAEVIIRPGDRYADIRILDPKSPGALLRAAGQSITGRPVRTAQTEKELKHSPDVQQAEIDRNNSTTLIIAGLGGSMRYRDGSDMYTEREMERRVRRIRRLLGTGQLLGNSSAGIGHLDHNAAYQYESCGGTLSGNKHADYVDDNEQKDKFATERNMNSESRKSRAAKLLLTHAPLLGHGDLEDLPHRGFACFNNLIEEWRPDYHCYGHVHMEYGRIRRESVHPSGTRLINCSGMQILEI